MDWIDVKKKRAPEGEAVLAIGMLEGQRTIPGVVIYGGRGKYYSADKIFKASAKVTHWMPLPSAPATPHGDGA